MSQPTLKTKSAELSPPLPQTHKHGRPSKLSIEVLSPHSVTNIRQDSLPPPLERVVEVLSSPHAEFTHIPLYGQISSDLITPSAAYLKVQAHSRSKYTFLFESAATERVGRYSFVGAGPRKILQTGPGFGEAVDPLPALEAELSQYVVADLPELKLRRCSAAQ